MFTGIVEETGVISKIKSGTSSKVLTIDADVVLKDTKIGDSIAVNGICLTVTGIHGKSFDADVMHETINRTSLKNLKANSKVNLERAMAANGRFGGHIVSGHVDGTGVIMDIKKDDNAVWYTIQAKENIMKYVVEKGSITIDGISLTVAATGSDYFKVSVIPHTREVTNLRDREINDIVNLECDIIGKYVEKLMFSQKQESGESKITLEFLRENGF